MSPSSLSINVTLELAVRSRNVYSARRTFTDISIVYLRFLISRLLITRCRPARVASRTFQERISRSACSESQRRVTPATSARPPQILTPSSMQVHERPLRPTLFAMQLYADTPERRGYYAVKMLRLLLAR